MTNIWAGLHWVLVAASVCSMLAGCHRLGFEPKTDGSSLGDVAANNGDPSSDGAPNGGDVSTGGDDSVPGDVRLPPVGSPVVDFGNEGVVQLDFGIDDFGNDLVALADGTLVLTGNTGQDGFIARVDADGQLDPTFATGGLQVFDIQGVDDAHAIVRNQTGEYYVGGSSNNNAQLFVARFLADGNADLSWGSNGSVTIALASSVQNFLGLGVLSSGSVQIAVTLSNDDVFVARQTPAGAPDVSLAGTGDLTQALTPASTACGMGLDENDRTIISAFQDCRLFRLTQGGTLDASFGAAGGWVASNVPTALCWGDPVVTPTGTILLSGQVSTEEDFALYGFLPDGPLDPDFANNGFAQVSQVESANEDYGHIEVRPDGRIVVAPTWEDTERIGTIMRFGPDGSFDPVFGGGWYEHASPLAVNTWGALALGPNAVVAIGTVTNGDRDVVLVKLHERP